MPDVNIVCNLFLILIYAQEAQRCRGKQLIFHITQNNICISNQKNINVSLCSVFNDLLTAVINILIIISCITLYCAVVRDLNNL